MIGRGAFAQPAAWTARGISAERARRLSVPLALGVIAALLVPLLLAGPSHLTSDESLYLAEAYNLAEGNGPTYPSGDAIVHRAPLFPAMLAPFVRAGGPDAAYAATKAFAVLNVLLVAALAWRLGGRMAAGVAGVAAAASAYLSELGTTLYLDPAQCAFLLMAMLAMLEGVRTRRVAWWAAAGLATGVAFLVKESAIQWAPMAIIAALALPSQRQAYGARCAIAFTLIFGATIAPWWAWTYAQTGELFLLGSPRRVAIEAVIGAVALAAGGIFVANRPLNGRWAGAAAAVLAVAWGGFLVYGLATFSSYPAPNDYYSTVPRYLAQVAPQMQPFFPIVAAWCWLAWRALQGDEGARLVTVAAALFAPFAIVAANRWLQLRDALPLVYLSYAVLGLAVADGWRALSRQIGGAGAMTAAAAGLAVVGGALVVHEGMTFAEIREREAVARDKAGSWDSPYTRDVAAWMESNIPAGARVMTSRQYFSSLHIETEGRYKIRQLPTVRVVFGEDGGPFVRARHNMFRWEDQSLRETLPDETWLHLQQFPEKGYWVGLSEQELLAFIAAHEIEYVVLTGDDIAFSSSAYAWYFSANPGFELMGTLEGSDGDRTFAYRVARDRLAAIPHSTSIHPRSAHALFGMTGMDVEALTDALGTPLRVTDVDSDLSERELEAAVAGVDLGAAEEFRGQ